MDPLYSLTDAQFKLVEPILREERDVRGRKPSVSDRHALEAVLYILRHGLRWRAMPPSFGHWMMVFMRYKRWVERGIWWKILMRLQRAGALRVSLTFFDSAEPRVHRYPQNGAPGTGKKN